MEYAYTPLECLRPPMEAHCYGVVAFLREARRTSADWLLCVGLVDPSMALGDSVVLFNIFRPERALLPQVQQGDVLRVHRADIKHYQGSKVGGTVLRKSQFVCIRPDRAAADPTRQRHTAAHRTAPHRDAAAHSRPRWARLTDSAFAAAVFAEVPAPYFSSAESPPLSFVRQRCFPGSPQPPHQRLPGVCTCARQITLRWTRS